MTWQPSDAWRDSYDSWKLATPPEYENAEDEDACPDCRGTGKVWLLPCHYKCETCNGTGYAEPESEPLDVDDDEFFNAPLGDDIHDPPSPDDDLDWCPF